jgi:serine O-acetyltransferase
MPDSAVSTTRPLWRTLRGWLAPRPAPQSGGGGARVQIAPPSAGPASVFEFLRMVVEDVDAVLEHDPAARNAVEVVLVYPGLHAIWMHRVAHAMWKRNYVLAPRLLAHYNRGVTGIEIHPGARLGRRVFIDHGMGIVIGETASVGDECLLYKGVVLGGTSLERKERHPTLGRGVVVGTNACVLGPIHIGDGAKIGSNSVVIRDVPASATVVGVPAKLAQNKGSTRAQLDHADLPDPVANLLSAFVEEIDALRARVALLEGRPEPKLAGRSTEHDGFDGDAT